MENNKSISEKERRAKNRITVWLLPEEKVEISEKADAHSMSASAYLRQLGLNHPIKSTIDFQSVLELCKINGDLARLGNLLKMWLTNQNRTLDTGRVTKLLMDLERISGVLGEKVDKL